MVNRQNQISRMLRNPSEVYNEMLNTDPEFRKFVEENKDKTIDQIAVEHGIDPMLIRKYIR